MGARLSGALSVRGLHKPVVVGMGALRLIMSPVPFTGFYPACFKTSCKSLSKARHLRNLLDKVVKVQHFLQQVGRGGNKS